MQHQCLNWRAQYAPTERRQSITERCKSGFGVRRWRMSGYICEWPLFLLGLEQDSDARTVRIQTFIGQASAIWQQPILARSQ